MKYAIAAFLLLGSAASIADKPDVLPGNNGDNGNHYAYGKEKQLNQRATRRESAQIPEAGTFALIGLGLVGLIITRSRSRRK